MRILVLFILIIMISCKQKDESKFVNLKVLPEISVQEVEIPNVSMDKSEIVYDNKVSKWYFNNHLFSGYAVSYYPDSTLKEKIGVFKGKRENLSQKWFPNGKLKEVANFREGKLHGEKKLWVSDSIYTLVTQLNYQFGKVDGEQRMWYSTGELYKVLNLNMGIEEGMQQAYRKNGELYANYEAKEGRIFGLKKSALCYGLEDENIKFER